MHFTHVFPSSQQTGIKPDIHPLQLWDGPTHDTDFLWSVQGQAAQSGTPVRNPRSFPWSSKDDEWHLSVWKTPMSVFGFWGFLRRLWEETTTQLPCWWLSSKWTITTSFCSTSEGHGNAVSISDPQRPTLYLHEVNHIWITMCYH